MNNELAKTREYQKYLQGYKGLACMLIMLMHYLGLYKYSHGFEPKFVIVDMILDSKLDFVLNEGFWLYGFFVISGYLVARSSIDSFMDIIKKAFTRFLRFALPIIFSYFVIFIVYKCIGFHNAETIQLFDCGWYQSYFDSTYTILDVLKGPFDVLILANTSLNAPYWVLKSMFFSSILIYCLKYVYSKLNQKHEAVCFIILFGVTVLSEVLLNSVFTACLFGMMVEIYYHQIETISKKSYFACGVMITGILIYIWPDPVISAIFFATVLIYVPRVKVLNHILSSNAFQFGGKISWGIFSFHWPMICSFGAVIMLTLHKSMNVVPAYIIGCVATIIITILISTIYYYTFEKWTTCIVKKIAAMFR